MNWKKRALMLTCSAVGVLFLILIALTAIGATSDHLSSLDMHLIPGINNFYDLGSASKHWRKIFVDEIDAATPLDVNVVSPNPLPISGTITGAIDISGVTPHDEGIAAIPYYYLIADGEIANHTSWSKIGFNPALVANTEADAWSATGSYVFPTSAAGMEVVSSDNTQDIGTSIFSGTSSGGSTTTLVDATKDFTAGTPVAIGDCIILDKSGTTPEFGFVSAVTNATTLTVSGGFSDGGTGSVRVYSIIDKSAYTVAQAVEVKYLNGSYVEDSEIVILNGTTVVPTVQTDLYRINSFRVIAAGTDAKAKGNLSIRNLADTPVYSYISANHTRARNIIYTVPLGKSLFITSGTFGYGYTHNSTHYCRIYTRANVDPTTGFQTDGIMYPFSEFVCANNTVVREFEFPTKLTEKTDIKVSAVADYAGILEVALRGWLENN